MELTRIRNDINGNPRYVIHFLNLLTEEESNDYGISISEKYSIAINRSHKLGGRKYHNKSYGGGIVFQSYNTDELIANIRELIERCVKGE